MPIIQQNISLKPYNTFGIEATARFFTEVFTIEEIKEVIQNEEFKQMPQLILGGGSNMLLTQDFDGLVIKISLKKIQVLSQTDSHVHIEAGAGVVWHNLVMWTLSQDFGGIENLSLIPGTVGAAPMQNIGAYGVEIKDVFVSLEALNKQTFEIETFTLQDCQFGYRESIFKHQAKNQYIITSVIFKLTRQAHTLHVEYGAIRDTLAEMQIEQPSIQDVSRAVIHIRQSKLPDPTQIGNAGSFFKNPEIPKTQYESLKEQFAMMPSYPVSDNMVKVPAGWLIEQAGWKGYRTGDIGVHAKQALVLVNYGNGKGQDIKDLAFQVQASVVAKFGINISPEVNFI
jgi:UDP-N-acetylmuramate dehydrogenase